MTFDEYLDIVSRSHMAELVSYGTPELEGLLTTACNLFEKHAHSDQLLAMACMVGMILGTLEREIVPAEAILGIPITHRERLAAFRVQALVVFWDSMEARGQSPLRQRDDAPPPVPRPTPKVEKKRKGARVIQIASGGGSERSRLVVANPHACVLCHKSRAGRFTRQLSGAPGIWTKGQLPAWYCYVCLPQGVGRGEEMSKTLPVIDVTPMTAKDKREGLALITPLQQEVDLLDRISTPGELAVADELFGRIQRARKTWKLKMYGTPTKPGPIPSIRSGLDQLYELNREVDKPLEQLETTVEQAMKAYHREAFKREQEEHRAKMEREAKAQREFDELERKKLILRTPAAKAKIEEQILEKATEIEEIQQEDAPERVEVEHSTARPTRVPVCVSVSEVAQGVVDGLIPEDCLTVNMVKVRAYYKSDPTAVALFPGIELQDDVAIVGR